MIDSKREIEIFRADNVHITSYIKEYEGILYSLIDWGKLLISYTSTLYEKQIYDI